MDNTTEKRKSHTAAIALTVGLMGLGVLMGAGVMTEQVATIIGLPVIGLIIYLES
jgi:hypothetical protein